MRQPRWPAGSPISFRVFDHATIDEGRVDTAGGRQGMKTIELDVVATRGDEIESRHSVHAAIVGPDDSLIAAARNPQLVTSSRSCAKPFQVMPFLLSGAFDDLHWGDDQLALACASHGGEPEHVAIADAMLRDIGLEEGDLACGPHD